MKRQKIISEVSGKRYTRESFMGELNKNQLIAPFCYKGTCDTALFNFWLANFLLLSLNKCYLLIMDNATFHQSPQTRQLINAAGY